MIEAYVHDRSASRLDHVRDDGPRAEERAGQADVEDLLPPLSRQIDRSHARANPGIIDEHVDVPELRHCRCHSRSDLFLVGDVKSNGPRALAEGLDLARRGLRSINCEISHHNVCPGLRESERSRTPNAGSCPGHERHPFIEAHSLGPSCTIHLPSVWSHPQHSAKLAEDTPQRDSENRSVPDRRGAPCAGRSGWRLRSTARGDGTDGRSRGDSRRDHS
jgi:hypothetical protein